VEEKHQIFGHVCKKVFHEKWRQDDSPLDDSSPEYLSQKLILAPPDSPPQALGDEPIQDWLPLS
jgi:hypothetical protein